MEVASVQQTHFISLCFLMGRAGCLTSLLGEEGRMTALVVNQILPSGCTFRLEKLNQHCCRQHACLKILCLRYMCTVSQYFIYLKGKQLQQQPDTHRWVWSTPETTRPPAMGRQWYSS